MVKRNQGLIPVVLAITLLGGCQKSPYNFAGTIVRNPPNPAPSASPTPDPSSNPSEMVIDLIEGKAQVISLASLIVGAGQAIVAVDGLPEGARFSPQDLTLAWTPRRALIADTAAVVLKVSVMNDADGSQVTQSSVVLRVHAQTEGNH